MSRNGWAAAAAIGVLIVLAAGCGSSKKSAAPPPAPTTTAAQTTTEAMTTDAAAATTPTTTSSSSSSSSGTPSFGSTKNCAELAGLASKVSKALAPVSGGSYDVKAQANALEALANAAPEAIRADFKTFADAFVKLAQVYADSNFKVGQVPNAEQIAKLTEASKGFNTPKVEAAMRRIGTWTQANCGGTSAYP